MCQSDGDLYGAGRNDDGVLGFYGQTSSPTVVGSGKSWASGGHGNNEQTCHGITDANGDNSGGQLWYIGGVGSSGQGGDGTLINRTSPVQVGTDTDWLLVNVGGQANGDHHLAIKASS